MASAPVLFRQLFDPTSSSYTYLVADPSTREAMLVDPVTAQLDRDVLLVQELGLRLVYVVETHSHGDRESSARTLRDALGARLVAGEGFARADVRATHGATLALGALTVEVLATPGHARDGISLRVGDRVLTGDALLIRATGRTDHDGGDAGTLYDSITGVLFALPDETQVYPAHDYRGRTASTIGEEKRFNLRLAGKRREDFVAIMGADELPAGGLLGDYARGLVASSIRHGQA